VGGGLSCVLGLSVVSSTFTTMPEPIVYAPHERPDVEGALGRAVVSWRVTYAATRQRRPVVVHVQYRRPAELSSHVANFRSEHVRKPGTCPANASQCAIPDVPCGRELDTPTSG
jgi:hypothetical protein